MVPSTRRTATAAQFPNFTYGSNVGVHDLRMYVGPALDASQAREHTVKDRQADHGRH